MTHSIQLHRVLRATPELVYRAILDPQALSRWLPPDGFTGQVEHLDARVGGTFAMSFTEFATGQSHRFGGTYLELEPNARIRFVERFDDPALAGEMVQTYTLKAVSLGTELHIEQTGIPAVIPAEMCYLGWQESLLYLARLVERGTGE